MGAVVLVGWSVGWLAGCPLPSFPLSCTRERATDGAGKNSVTEMEERKLMTKREGEREREREREREGE